MGVVYLAEHVVLGRKVAIKTVNSISNYGRFLREAREASKLSHPNIAAIYDFGRTDSGQPYLVMEYVEGKTLAGWIADADLTIPKSLRIVRKVAEALSEAHRHNIIHRDIKPANIAVDDRGIVKVLDFGLAKEIGLKPAESDNTESDSSATKTREGVVVGTPMYFSPEQANALELDPRSDLFSLGLVLYECLCGKPAFSGGTPLEIGHKVSRDDPVPPSVINPAISTDVERVTLRALEKAKEDRYQSATDFVANLKSLEISFSSAEKSIDHTEIRPKRKTAGTDRSRKIKRLALPVLAVLIVAVVLAWILFNGQKQKSAIQPKLDRLAITGNIIEAAISPDGEYVAYVKEENGEYSIRLYQPTTGSDIPVVSAANTKYKGLSFFLDGKYLSYLQPEGDSADLYKVAKLGGRPPQKLATKVDTPVSFSPDGKQFTFVRYSAEAHSTTLLIANDDGSNEKALVTVTEPQLFSRGGIYSSGPAWSPDGKIIAVPAQSVTENKYREIIMVNVADGSMTSVKPVRWNIIEKIVWLPDGSGFLMNASEGKSLSLQIWLVDRNGDEARNISTDPSNYVGLSATKDSQVVLTIKNERNSSVWTGTPGSFESLTSSRYLGDWGITRTKDGKFVMASNFDGNYQIYITEPNGTNRKQLTIDEQSKMAPIVSPDGKYIVYVSVDGRHPHLWRMDIDGENQKQLTRGGDENLPRFTADGQSVVYHSIDPTGYTIRKISIDGGEPVTLVSDYATQPDVSPDGKMLACFARRPGATTLQIIVVPIDGGPPIRTFALPPTVDPEWPGLRWTPDGAALTYVVTDGGISNIWSQDLKGGEAKPLSAFKESKIFFFDWPQYKRELVLVRGSDTRDPITISNFSGEK